MHRRPAVTDVNFGLLAKLDGHACALCSKQGVLQTMLLLQEREVGENTIVKRCATAAKELRKKIKRVCKNT